MILGVWRCKRCSPATSRCIHVDTCKSDGCRLDGAEMRDGRGVNSAARGRGVDLIYRGLFVRLPPFPPPISIFVNRSIPLLSCEYGLPTPSHPPARPSLPHVTLHERALTSCASSFLANPISPSRPPCLACPKQSISSTRHPHISKDGSYYCYEEGLGHQEERRPREPPDVPVDDSRESSSSAFLGHPPSTTALPSLSSYAPHSSSIMAISIRSG